MRNDVLKSFFISKGRFLPYILFVSLFFFSFERGWGQQNVFSRSGISGNWWDNANPWYYQTDNNNQNRPDNNARHFVKIGHNQNLTMTTNGAFFALSTLDFEAGASSVRTINGDGAGTGISLTGGIYNATVAAHIINADIGIDGSTVQLHNNSTGGMTFGGAIFINSNTVQFGGSGSGNFTVTGVMQGTNGNLTKTGTNTLNINQAATYTGTTTINQGTLTLGIANALPVGSSAGLIRFATNSSTFNLGLFNLGSSTAAANSAGALDFDVNTTINLAASGSNTYYFKASNGQTWDATTITINNWAGTPGASGTGRRIFVGSDGIGLTAAQLAKINFNTFSSGAMLLSTGELVPIQYYYSKSTGALDLTGTWGTNTDGSGASPTDFTASAIFNIRNNPNPTIANNWTLSGIASRVFVGDGSNACDFIVPSGLTFSAPDISVAANGKITYGSTATVSSTTVTNNGSIDMTSGGTLTIANGGSITNGAGGTFTRGSGTVTFSGAGTISGTIGFNNVNIAGAVEFGSGSTINGILQINANGFVNSTCPTYATGSTLQYNTGGTFIRGNEWTDNTLNLPFNVRVNAGTTLDMDVKKNPADNTRFDFESRSMRGDLDLYGTLTMGGNAGTMAEDLIVGGGVTIRSTGTLVLGCQKPGEAKIGDIQLGGNWVRESGGTFNPSQRAVQFNGSNALQTVTSPGTENFAYFVVDKLGNGTVKLNCPILIFGTNRGNPLQLLNGNLDMNGNNVTFRIYDASDATNLVDQNIAIDGTPGNLTRQILNSSATQAIFDMTHSDAAQHIDTIKRNSGNAALLTFGTNIVVQIGSTTGSGNAGVNFGEGITTINGTFRINPRGFVRTNPPTYAAPPVASSLLQYNVAGNYRRSVEWSTASGPGYPFNVQTSATTNFIAGGNSNNNTPLNMAGSLTVDAGTIFDMQDQSATPLPDNENMTLPLIVALDINLNGTLIASGNSLGNVQLGRNWTRNNTTGLFTHNTRRLIFNSAENAIIDLTSAGTEGFYALEIAKTSPLKTVTLNKPVVDTSDVTFTQGIIVSSNPNFLTFLAGATATNSSFNSFNSGPVRKIGTQAFTFPVGKIAVNTKAISDPSVDVKVGGYRPIAIGVPSASETFTAEYQLANPFSQGGINQLAIDAGLQGISRCEYWDLTRNGTATADVTLSWSSHPDGQSQCNVGQYVINTNPLRVVPYFNGMWGDQNPPYFGRTSVSGTAVPGSPDFLSFITWNGTGGDIDSYLKFVLGTTNWRNAPLPFKILDFHVKPKANQSNIQWLVNDETTVNSYVIERSVDGINFQPILNAASRYLNSRSSYQRYDENPAKGWNYYRLKVIDNEGKIQYSSIQKVWFGSAMQITISPNPASSVLNVYLPEPGKVLGLSIFNATGQRMREIRTVRNNESIDVSAYPTGQYILRVISADGVKAYPFVKD